MDSVDPFYGYSLLLRTLIYVVTPLFAAWMWVRLRRALHIFQLEGYKRRRFLGWVRANRPLFLKATPQKKPLVLTGRAWRLLVTSVMLGVALVLGAAAIAHLSWGAPEDLLVWAVASTAVFMGAPLILLLADVVLAPIQRWINRYYLRSARRKLDAINPAVVGVTGSFGKTSTKFAIAALLGGPAEALATPGSYNTPLGIARTINERLEQTHRFLVVEMGAYGEGEIAELCRFARPRIGVLTAIGPAHLERFGSLDAIRRAKYEIVSNLPFDGVAVMNVDDPEVRALADVTSVPAVIRYGTSEEGRPDITAGDVEVTPAGTKLTIIDRRTDESAAVETKLLGRHAVGHILAGVAVAMAAGLRLSNLANAIEGLEPVEHRLQLISSPGGITVIDDAYNSNPAGAEAAFELLAAMPARKKIIVTPGIIEFGPLQREANRRLGAHAAEVADVLIVVARVNRDALLEGARSYSQDSTVIAVDSLTQATEQLKQLVASGDVVLFENDLPDQYEGSVTPPK